MKNHKWRIFFAVPFNSQKQEELRKSLVHSDVSLPSELLDPSRWHITLYFIGSVEKSKIDPLIAKVRGKTWPDKFEVIMDHLGAFPEPQAAKTLWLGVGAGEARLHEMASEIAPILQELGLPSEQAISKGHLTISRFSRASDVTETVQTSIDPIQLQVDRFVLYRSEPELGPQNYEELASFHLSDPL